MTYPDNPQGLTSVGFFTQEGRDADKQRERLAAIGMQWFQQCQNDRVRQERQWYLNLAFFNGNQYVQFKRADGGGSFDLYVPPAPYYRTRIVVNQTRRIIRKEISRLTAQKPNAFVVPASSEDADVFAAQAGEQIWDSLWRRLKFNRVLREAVFWQAVCGNGFIKSYWDATKKDVDSDQSGDISIHNVTPFHLFAPDLMCTEIEDQPYLIQAQVKSKAWVQQNFNIDTSNSKLESIDEGLENVLGVTKNDNKKDETTLLEVWVKPGYLPELPEGGMFTIASNQVVQGFDSWPYEHGQYPFSKLDSIPTGKFYTSSIIEDLIPLQKELNRSRSQLIESKNKMSKPQLVAEKGAVDPKKITSEPGLVIQYNVGFQPPQPLPLQSLPSYVTEEINRLYTDMSDISGQHEVSNGSTPPGVTAATAISFLQEQDESLIATHYSSIEEAIEKIAGQSLGYVKMYWDEARTVKIVGIDGTFDVQTFKGADLRSNTDIRVEAGSALPTSRAAKQAFIMDLMKMGFIPPDEGLEIMEVGGLNRIYERTQVDKRQAQRENLKMRVVTDQDVQLHNQDWIVNHPEAAKDPNSGLNLIPPLIIPVNTYDNHQIHIDVHNNYRKSQNFEQASAQTKALFEEHVKQHMEAQAGIMTHPLTGMDPSDPNAPNPEDEEAAMDQTDTENAQDNSQEGTTSNTGPDPMPQLEGDSSSGGTA
jgi:hypothetical protein